MNKPHRRELKAKGRMMSPANEHLLPATHPRHAASGYDLPACVLLWASVMLGARSRQARESARYLAPHMLSAALASRSL